MDWIKENASIDNINDMTEFIIKKLSKDIDLSKKDIIDIRLICEEFLMNIINNAYIDEDGYMKILYEFDDVLGCMTLHFIDEGIAYNPTILDNQRDQMDTIDRPVSGIMNLMVTKIADSVTYERIGSENHFIVKKYYY